MIGNIDDLAETDLFAGIASQDIAELLDCVHARRCEYVDGDLIIEEGSKVSEFGIMLSGRGRSIKWDSADKLIIITMLEKGSEIGVLLAASPEHRSPVAVQALGDVSALMIPYNSMVARCEKDCSGHERLLRNYIGIVAQKGLVLHERINCLLKPTVREKVMNYLLRLSHEQQSKALVVPLNRNAMSAYLNIERSALSRELSNMKRDGVIDYHRNHFELL